MQDRSDICRIVNYSDHDRAKLEQFFREVWLPPPLEKSLQWFDWIFNDNPNAGPQRPSLLLAYLGEDVAGMLVLMPTPLFINGQSHLVAWGRDLFINPEHRRHKIALRLNAAWEELYEAALGSGQSETMRSLQLKYGWAEISPVKQHEKLFFDAQVLRNSLGEGIGKLCKRTAAMGYATLRTPRWSGPTGCTVTHSDAFDPAVETLWEACRGAYPFICSRDYPTLRWRFVQHPYYRYLITQMRDEQGGYLGYAVTRCEDKTCWLVDLLTRKEDAQARRTLIAAVEERCRAAGATRFICRSACAPLEASLKSMGYLATTFEQFAAVKAPSAFVAALPADCYITGMDSDIDR